MTRPPPSSTLFPSPPLSRPPPPPVGVTAPATPATGFPFASLTITDGGEVTAVPAVADWLVGLFAAIVAAAPAVPVAVKVTGLPVKAAEPGVNEVGPTGALRGQFHTIATPLALVVGLPPRIVPLPSAPA